MCNLKLKFKRQHLNIANQLAQFERFGNGVNITSQGNLLISYAPDHFFSLASNAKISQGRL